MSGTRRVLRAIGLISLAIIVCVAAVLIWVSTRRPVVTVDYAALLEESCAAAQPEGTDGWPAIVAATDVSRRLVEAFPVDERPELVGQPVDLDVLEERQSGGDPAAIAYVDGMVAWLDQEDAFGHIDRAGDAARFVRPIATHGGAMLMILLPELAELRNLGRALRHRARRRAASGDIAGAAADVERILVLARAAGRQVTLIDHLVGYSLRSLAGRLVRDLALGDGVTAADVGLLADAYEKGGPLSPLALALDGERASFLDAIQRLYAPGRRGILCPGTSSELGEGRAIAGELVDVTTGPVPMPAGMNTAGDPPDIVNVLGLLYARRGAVEDEANEIYDGYVARSKMTWAERQAGASNTEMKLMQLGWRYHLLRVLLPALDAVSVQHDRAIAEIDATRTTLAIVLHELEHDAPPATLELLVPDRLATLPFDPYSGASLRYVVDGDAWKLYGVGRDRTDDGGHVPVDNPTLGLRSDRPGTDVVYARRD